MVFTPQLQTDRPCSSSAITRRPGSLLQPRGGGRLCGTAGHAPCGTGALHRPRLQLGLCACSAHRRKRFQLPVTAEIRRSREEAAAIFNLPDQHPATKTRLGSATCAQLCGCHLCTSQHTPLTVFTGVTSPHQWHFQQLGLTLSKDFFHEPLFPQLTTTKPPGRGAPLL